MARVYRKLRAAGQNAPAFASSWEFLAWGGCLLAGSEELNAEQAEAAWRAHEQHVRESWARYWQQHGILPTCWAERVFDGTAQIETETLDPWARARVRSLEAGIKSWQRGQRKSG
jgi:hypothetical protein